MKKLYLFLLFVFLSFQGIYSQSKTITGKVLNMSDKNSIPGANVKVKGSTTSASTDFDGSYSIKVSSGDVLIFSFIGLQTKEIKVGESNTITAYLEDATKTLDQIVVLGSTVKSARKELGNAITSVKSKDLLRAQPNSLSSALQGKVAGALITQNSGDPSGGFSIKLRGTSSIVGSSDPLYVIDGVVMSNSTRNVTNLDVSTNSNMQIGQNRTSDINPNDIESVEILNGGAAAAIYGSRAANGVILITTKKGKSGTTKYSFSTTTSVNTLRKRVYTNLSDRQFVNTKANPSLPPGNYVPNDVLYINSGQPSALAILNPNDYVKINQVIDPLTGLFTANSGIFLNKNFTTGNNRYDYQDNIFTTGIGTDTYFSLNGGDDKTKYFASLGYLKNEGIIKNTDFQRINTKLRLDHKFNDKISATVGLSYINSFSNEKPDGNRFWSPINSINITNNIYDITRTDAAGNLLAVESNRYNPLTVIEKIKDTQQIDRVLADVQFNLKPFKNFTVDYIFGIDTYNQQGSTFIPRYPYTVKNIPGVTIYPNNPGYSDGYASESFNRVTQFNNDLNLRYLWDVNNSIKLTTSAGYNIQTYRDKFTATIGQDLKPFVETLSGFNSLIGIASETNPYNLWGYYLQETASFKNKLFITGAIRNDASTAFGSENRSNLYKKLSGSYVVSSEEFMKNSIISTARIRGSWGESGNLSGVGPYARFTNYSSGNIGAFSTYTLAGLRQGNSEIKPEKSVTTEFGVDLGFAKDRIVFSGSYYNADIQDLLLNLQTAPSSGSASNIQNIGTMNNKGYEVSLKIDAIKTEKMNLSLFGTYSQNRNIVTGLTDQTSFALDSNESGAPIFVRVGSPIGVYYGTYYARNPDGSFLLTPGGYPQPERGSSATNQPLRNTIPGPNFGQPIGTLINKEIGNPNPDFIFSAGMNFNYKKFGLSVLFDGVRGGDIFDADYRTRQGVGVGEFAYKELSGELPRGYIPSIYPIQEFRVVDGSYTKLREITLNYSLGRFVRGIDDLTITLSGRNLYSWDKFTSFDPETNSGGQTSIAKYNFGTVPAPRTCSVALKFQF